MSEQYSPKSFDDGDSDYRQFKDMQYRDELLGGAEQGSARYEEAKAYDEHLKALKDKEGRTDDDVYNEAIKQPDAVDRAIAAGSSQVRFMKALAEQIATLRNKAVDTDRADRDVQALKDKEDSFNDRLADYEDSEDADPSVIDRLMELATAEQAAAADNSGETGEQITNSTDFTSLPVEKQRELLRTLFGKELVDQLSDADLAKYAVASDKIPGVEAAVAASNTEEEEKAASSQEGADSEDGSDTGTDADTDHKVDSDSAAKASDEVLKEVHLTPEERKRRDLLNLYRNASSDEMRRISEAAWGEKGMEGYDESMAYGVSDDEAVDIMQTAFDNGYRVAGQEASQDTEASDDDADAAEQQDSSDDETEEQDAPTGFLNRLRSRWDNMENRRKKVTRAIAGVALTAIGVTGAVVAYKLHMDHTAVLDAANNLKSTGIKPSEHANDPQAFANFVGSLKDLHVGAGQGVYDVLAHNGIDKSKVSYAELYDLQRQFPKELYLQQVGNVTDVRITNPGTLSQPLADALAKFASN